MRDGWRDLARRVEDLGWSTLTIADHFDDALAPIPALMAAADATTTLRVGSMVLRQRLPPPGGAGQGGRHPRRAHRWPLRPGHRRRVDDHRLRGRPGSPSTGRACASSGSPRRWRCCGASGPTEPCTVRRRPLPDHGARRAPEAAHAGRAADRDRRRRSAGPRGWPGARPTSSASTSTWRRGDRPPGVLGRHPGDHRREGRVGAGAARRSRPGAPRARAPGDGHRRPRRDRRAARRRLRPHARPGTRRRRTRSSATSARSATSSSSAASAGGSATSACPPTSSSPSPR